MVADRPLAHLQCPPPASRFRAKQARRSSDVAVRRSLVRPVRPCASGAVEEWPVQRNVHREPSAADWPQPNQTKARIALVSLGVGIGLDQPIVRGTANNTKNAN